MFKDRLAEALQIKGWTQGFLARSADVSQAHLSLLLHGRREPSLAVAAKLAQALDLSLDWLVDTPSRRETLRPDEVELLWLYRRLSSETLRRLVLQAAKNAVEAEKA